MRTLVSIAINRPALTLGLGLALFSAQVSAIDVPPQVDAKIAEISRELAKLCPLADAGDQAAFDACRKGLFDNSKFRDNLNPSTLWGRNTDPDKALRNTHLTQFNPDMLSGLYVPLFMFDGSYKISYNEREKLYLATLGVAFRNRLQPGQFPYPFWHEENKWTTYEKANQMFLWIDPKTNKTRVAQFSKNGTSILAKESEHVVPPKFDGQWLWTDNAGKTQPAVTLFDGLFSAQNPYKEPLAKSYREFALQLRDSQCMECHVPNNPDGMKKLVLLQTPAHAANHIKRTLKEVRDDKMPVNEHGTEVALEPALKKALLDKGGEFDRIVDLARGWEKSQSAMKSKDTTKADAVANANQSKQ